MEERRAIAGYRTIEYLVWPVQLQLSWVETLRNRHSSRHHRTGVTRCWYCRLWVDSCRSPDSTGVRCCHGHQLHCRRLLVCWCGVSRNPIASRYWLVNCTEGQCCVPLVQPCSPDEIRRPRLLKVSLESLQLSLNINITFTRFATMIYYSGSTWKEINVHQLELKYITFGTI